MDNYGDPILDKKNNLIGYKINDSEHASISTYYNEDNLLCNKISIRDFDDYNLSFIGDDLISWVDVKTESGFIRELDKKKYYYDKKNNLFNVESIYSCLSFPQYKKDVNLDNKIGTLDFETYGSNFGTGYHQVYAGGWAVKGLTNLFYVENNETSENLVNRIFLSIFQNKNLDGYTFYAHNLGRFDSIFIVKSLILNNKFQIIPI
jgi:hypothetical protein